MGKEASGLDGKNVFIRMACDFYEGVINAQRFKAEIERLIRKQQLAGYFVELCTAHIDNQRERNDLEEELSCLDPCNLIRRLIQLGGITINNAAAMTGLTGVVKNGRSPRYEEAIILAGLLESTVGSFLSPRTIGGPAPWYQLDDTKIDFSVLSSPIRDFRHGYYDYRVAEDTATNTPDPDRIGICRYSIEDYTILSITVRKHHPLNSRSWELYLLGKIMAVSPSVPPLAITKSHPWFSDGENIYSFIWSNLGNPSARLMLYSKVFSSRTSQVTLGSYTFINPTADRKLILQHMDRGGTK